MTPRPYVDEAQADYDWEALLAEAELLRERRRTGSLTRKAAIVARNARTEELAATGMDLRHPNDVAELLGLDRSTVTRWAQRGFIVRYFVTAARGKSAPYFVDVDACRAHVAKRGVKSRPKRNYTPKTRASE